MNAAEIIEEINALPEEEQAKVLDFFAGKNAGKLSPVELGNLAEIPDEAGKISSRIISGFYGN